VPSKLTGTASASTWSAGSGWRAAAPVACQAVPVCLPFSYSEKVKVNATLHTARRMRLTTMQPRGGLSSTGYALADPGEEYLILQPAEQADPFTVTMDPGSYAAQWHGVNSRHRAIADEVTAGRHAVISFTAPFARPEPAVLHLTKTGPLADHQN